MKNAPTANSNESAQDKRNYTIDTCPHRANVMAVGRRVQFSLIRIAVAAPADVVIMVALLALVLSGAA